MENKERTEKIRRASWLGIFGNGFLSLLKITVGFLSHSLALVGDGIDSLSDIVTSLISLFAARIMSAPPDREHPWGHGRAETIATRLIGFAMFTAGLQLLISTVHSLTSGEVPVLPGRPALIAAVISIILKIALAAYKSHMGRKWESTLLTADAQNMRNDVLLSSAVLVGLFVSRLTGMALFDRIIAILLSFYILASAVRIFRESGSELMDGMEDPEVYSRLFEAVEKVPGALNPHRCRIRKINTLYDIDLDIEVDGDISVRESHHIAHEVEEAIRGCLPRIFDIMVHVEPAGTSREDEQFGLSPQGLEEK